MRAASSSLRSTPDETRTSASSVMSVAFSTGLEGGPIVPAAVGGAIVLYGPFTPFGEMLFCGVLKLCSEMFDKLGDPYGD